MLPARLATFTSFEQYINNGYFCTNLYQLVFLISISVAHDELFSSNNLWPRSFTFIGGLSPQHRLRDILPLTHTLEGLRGAIQKVNKIDIFVFIFLIHSFF